jgi:hypothetical protein
MCDVGVKLVCCSFACLAIIRENCLFKGPPGKKTAESPAAVEETIFIASLGDFYMPAPMGRGIWRARI